MAITCLSQGKVAPDSEGSLQVPDHQQLDWDSGKYITLSVAYPPSSFLPQQNVKRVSPRDPRGGRPTSARGVHPA